MADVTALGLEGGASAAERVFANIELRLMLLNLLDHHQLLKMLRLSEEVTDVVVDVIYRHMTLNEAETKGRFDTPRRAAHASSVRAIDITALPKPASTQQSIISTIMNRPPHVPLSYNPRSPHMVRVLKRFSGLRWVQDQDCHLSGNQSSVSEVVEGKIVLVELETIVELDLNAHPFHSPQPPIMPKSPAWKGIKVSQAYVIKFVKSSHSYHWDEEAGERDAHLCKWRDWLLRNEELDRGICSFYFARGVPKLWASLTFKQAATFLSDRRERGCAPWVQWEVNEDKDGTLAELKELFRVLGGDVRVISIGAITVATAGGLQEMINILDQECPNLTGVSITYIRHPDDSFTLKAGLSKTRVLNLQSLPLLRISAERVYRLGSQDVIITDKNSGDAKYLKAWQKQIADLKLVDRRARQKEHKKDALARGEKL